MTKVPDRLKTFLKDGRIASSMTTVKKDGKDSHVVIFGGINQEGEFGDFGVLRVDEVEDESLWSKVSALM